MTENMKQKIEDRAKIREWLMRHASRVRHYASRIMYSKGFTLVEILFAIAIGLILMGAIYIAVQSGQRSSVAIEAKTTAQQDVRAALELMALEIGMASYNPTYTANIWTTGCNVATANNTYKGIQFVAGNTLANAITVTMDIRGNVANTDGEGVLDDANEIISYVYDAANQRITREVSCGGAQPFLDTVRVINNTLPINNGNGVPAIFRYYDGMGAEIYPDANPLVIPNIRKIDITLAVETNAIDPNTGQRRSMIYSTRVIPRNHAISP